MSFKPPENDELIITVVPLIIIILIIFGIFIYRSHLNVDTIKSLFNINHQAEKYLIPEAKVEEVKKKEIIAPIKTTPNDNQSTDTIIIY